MRILAGGVQGVFVIRRAIFTDGAARLHRVRDQTVVDQLKGGDVVRALDRLIGRGAVILDPAPVKALVGADLVVHIIRAAQRLFHVDDGGQLFDIDLDGFRGIARLGFGLCDNGGIGVADVADLAMGENRALGLLHRFAVTAVDEPTGGVAADLDEILAGKDREDTGHAFGRGGVDGFDDPVGHGGARKDRCRLAVGFDVVAVPALASQETNVFAALGGCANSGIFGHWISSLFNSYSAAMALTS